jgi:hypothetical protein
MARRVKLSSEVCLNSSPFWISPTGSGSPTFTIGNVGFFCAMKPVSRPQPPAPITPARPASSFPPAGYDIGGDEGYGHQLMDGMAEEGFYLQRFNNGSPAKHEHAIGKVSRLVARTSHCRSQSAQRASGSLVRFIFEAETRNRRSNFCRATKPRLKRKPVRSNGWNYQQNGMAG